MKTPYESTPNTTATYHEAIAYYELLAEKSDFIQVLPFGMTDSGHPLHEVIIDMDKDFDPAQSRAKNKSILFINNGIHPGEPCGIDASMMLARDLVQNHRELIKDITIVIIPIYNIGGSLNRGSYSRANQVGPAAYGFRGNAKNYDLNRDFIKCDSKNALSFNQLFTKWSPDVFIDNHTSNGADYQYVMTLIATQKDKLEPSLSKYLTEVMLPELYSDMDKKGYEMIPYVDSRGTPDTGIYDFADNGRYSSGYGAIHNTLSFMPETHMLKPYEDRVKSTYLFMETMLEHIHNNRSALLKARTEAIQNTITKDEFHLEWALNYDDIDSLTFKGYEAAYKPSEVSGHSRLYYDRSKPYTKKIPYYNKFEPSESVMKPKAYIIPQAYAQIIEKMKANGVLMTRLTANQLMEVEVYQIVDYKTSDRAYEGHYIHSKVEVETSIQKIQYYTGDYLIHLDQPANKYIIETLEPEAPDSWFAWNFFDAILMQKEHFSPYVFEDLAAGILKENPEIKRKLIAKRAADPEFADNAYAQLNFVYELSKYHEPTYNRYPVGRILK